MNKAQKIGWQKYEDVLEARINSPLVDTLFSSIVDKLPEKEEEEDTEILYDPTEKEEPILLNMGGDLSNEITLAASFDCWLGHTNFNLTEEIKEGLISRAGDIFYAFRFLKLLVTPWEKTKAFEYGIVDKEGKKLKKPSTPPEKSAYTIFHKLVFNLKRILNKLPFGKTK